MSADSATLGFTPSEEKWIDTEYHALIQDYLNSNHRQKVEIIDRAFALARQAHAGVRRRSGEPYILHPIAVARIICSEMGLGSTSICCALLHDVVEDTDYTVDDMRQMFGDKIAHIVDGVTKVKSGSFEGDASEQAESFRKLLLTMSDDARVILIKVADRLHNMRTLSSMLPAKQYKIAGETLFIYAPLAHRFGLFAIKSELEDLSFKYEHPERYEEIATKVAKTEQEREELFCRFAEPIREALTKQGISFDIKSRVKTNYSIWHKMETKGVPFEEVYDLFAVRIIFDSSDGYPEKNRCWDIYTTITEIYQSRPDRLRDWLTNPKSNGYQALHLTVMGPDGNWIEVQIRSQKMDDIAEKGLAAHWKYKQGQIEEDKEFERWLDTIREVLQSPTPNAMDMLDTVKLSLFANDITVFTPKGKSIKLPAGASVLDFAYSIHSELGDRCIGAKVNHHVVPISTKLQNGDQIEILDSKSAQPQPQWLNFVITAKARYKIDAALRRRQREYIQNGEEQLANLLELSGLKMDQSIISKLSKFYGYERKEDLLASIGNGTINISEDLDKIKGASASNPTFFSRIISSLTRSGKSNKADQLKVEPDTEPIAQEKIDKKKPYILTESAGRTNYRVASCCKPIWGDDVLGIIYDRNKVEIHRRSCRTATRIKSSHGDRLVSAQWGEHHQEVFSVDIAVRGIDTRGILNAISHILLEELKLSISGINLRSKDGFFEGELSVLVHGQSDVVRVCQSLQRNNSILAAHRISLEQ